jgi:hypothetical protein
VASALDGDGWLASRHGRFCSGEGIAIALWIGGEMKPPNSLDIVEKKIISIPSFCESNPDCPVV